LSAALKAADKPMLYFTEQVCWLLPKQLTNLLAAFKAAEKND
jgi:hypothetical protein